jgi:hypothetical protein
MALSRGCCSRSVDSQDLPDLLLLRSCLAAVYLDLPRRSRFTLRAACGRQCWFAPPRGCLTLRAAYAAYRTTALLLGSQPAPAGMCSRLRFQVSGFRFLLPPPSAIPASPREPLAFVLHVYFTALSSVALTNSPQMAKCHHD